MKSSLMFLILVLMTSVCLAAPRPIYNPSGPGIDLPFHADSNDAVNPANPYGVRLFAAGVTFDTWAGVFTGDSSFARYAPSRINDNNNVTPMSPWKDWVLEFTYGLTQSLYAIPAPEFVLAAKAKGMDVYDKPIVALVRDINEHVYLMAGGSGSGKWNRVGPSIDMTPPLEGESWKIFTIHYKASGAGGGVLDGYVRDWTDANEVKLFENYSVAHGDYALDFIQMQPCTPIPSAYQGYDKFRMIQVAQPYITGDINKDGKVDMLDVRQLSANWLTSTKP
jgi:hypothetical protein